MDRPKKIWSIIPPNHELQFALSKKLGISPIIAQVLINRGIKTHEEAEAFLYAGLEQLHDPFAMQGMNQAVKRIQEAIERRERICIYGDYDVDGITSTVLLVRTFARLGVEVEYYLPERLTEGYGLNSTALDLLAEKGVKLIITVDCGIGAVDQVAYGRSLGMEVIITDHHQPPPELPECYILNPKIKGCTYPFKELAGVGVAFKLGQALIASLAPQEKDAYFIENLDLVVLGTIADIVPLTGENRLLIKYGLPNLHQTANLGLQCLITAAGLGGKPLQVRDVAFGLAPRLNAAGRIAHAGLGAELLLTQTPERAEELAKLLDDENRLRQQIEAQILEEAKKLIEETVDFSRERVIVLASHDWHPGVIGIVASKLLEIYYRPVILLSVQDSEAKGSARSIEEFNIFMALQHCAPLLKKYGGHAQAAGLTLAVDDIQAFREKLNAYAAESLSPEILTPKLWIDSEVQLENLNNELAEQLKALAPYGTDNPPPVLACCGVTAFEVKAVGSAGQHLKLKLGRYEGGIEAFGYGMGEWAKELRPGQAVDLAFTLETNVWRGQSNLQLGLKDIRKHDFSFNMAPFFADTDPHTGKKSTGFRFVSNFCVMLPGNLQLIDRRGITDKKSYLKTLLEQGARVLVYTNTPAESDVMVKFLNQAFFGQPKSVACCHGGLNEEERTVVEERFRRGELTTIISSYGSTLRLPLCEFDHIVLYHLGFNLAQFYCLNVRDRDGAPLCLHLLYNFEDALHNERMLNRYAPERRVIAYVYLVLKKLAGYHGESVARNTLQATVKLPGLTLQNCLVILEELNLLRTMIVEGEELIKLLPVPAHKLDLEASPFYKQGQKRKKDFAVFKEFALNASLTELVQVFINGCYPHFSKEIVL